MPSGASRVRAALTTVAVAGGAGILVGSLLPWARSGRASRSSYRLVLAAERLDLLSGSAALAARAWYLVPLGLGCAALALSLGRRRAGLLLVALTAALTLVLAWVVERSPLPTEVGWTTSALAAAAALLAVAGDFLVARRHPDSRLVHHKGL